MGSIAIFLAPDNQSSIYINNLQYFTHLPQIIFFSKLSIEIKACLGATNDTVHVGFVRSMDFDNISIVALKTPINISEEKLLLYIRYEGENYESSDVSTTNNLISLP